MLSIRSVRGRAPRLPSSRTVSLCPHAGVSKSRVGTPLARVGTPLAKKESPRPQADSPQTRGNTPPSRAASPQPQAASPQSRADSPHSRMGSPQSRADSPHSRAESPRSQSGFPQIPQQSSEVMQQDMDIHRGPSLESILASEVEYAEQQSQSRTPPSMVEEFPDYDMLDEARFIGIQAFRDSHSILHAPRFPLHAALPVSPPHLCTFTSY